MLYINLRENCIAFEIPLVNLRIKLLSIIFTEWRGGTKKRCLLL